MFVKKEKVIVMKYGEKYLYLNKEKILEVLEIKYNRVLLFFFI